MRRKKYIALLLCCSMAGGILTGCGESKKSRNVNEVKIGVTVYDQYDTFISRLMDQFNQYAARTMEEADSDLSIQIEVYNAGKSQTTQNSQVENMIAGLGLDPEHVKDHTITTGGPHTDFRA